MFFGDDIMIRFLLCAVSAGVVWFTLTEHVCVATCTCATKKTVINEPIWYEPDDSILDLNGKLAWKGINSGRQPEIANRGLQQNRVNYYRDTYQDIFDYNENLDWWNNNDSNRKYY